MKRLLCSSLVALPLCAFAASGPDADFYTHAAQGGIAQVELGSLALTKSGDPVVKKFAAQMVKDHSDANDKLRSVAVGKNMSLPFTESDGDTATKAKLEALSGSTFDRSYIEVVVKDHEQDVAEFRKEAQSGQDPEAKAFAASTLPTLEAHLQEIRSIANKSGMTARR